MSVSARIRQAADTLLRTSLLLAVLCTPTALMAQGEAFDGHWRINPELSDDTDRQVEESLRAAGQKVRRRWFGGGGEERYRGGPEEQALYDHISYDSALVIESGEGVLHFRYEHKGENFERPVYTDDRNRSVSLNAISEVRDFSFGHWEGEALLVEARPRDGGFTEERYEISPEGRLRVKLYIQPRSFLEPIEILRIYDRVVPSAGNQ